MTKNEALQIAVPTILRRNKALAMLERKFGSSAWRLIDALQATIPEQKYIKIANRITNGEYSRILKGGE